ncbi:MAG TPA: hypothetical protein VKV16_11415, partial [Solirubrobacteraceae bacterium]|nr:hypothetical protein [Solirubrobacteraceae bacterium]
AARSSSTASSTPSSACAATVAQTLAQVGERIYRAAASSEDVTQAVHRVQSSAALARAVASGDAAAARAALRSLQLGQIVRVQVLRGGRVLASAGSGGALAPVRGSIPGTNATFVLSVQSDANYVEVARQVSGAQVQISSAAAHGGAGRWLAGAPHQALPARGPVTLAGARYEVASFAGSAFPSGGARIALLVPASASSCAGSSAQARVETLGHVGERIYEEELHGASVARTLRIMQASSAFQHAVAARSASATRAAIVGFFRAHLHVVRVRVSVDGRLLVDVGGPYVLAPVHGTLRSGGRVVGRFTWAIQDDAGYEKLARLFTGAQVLMREGSRQVMGTLSPGPASVPARGTVGYGGRSYEAYSFDAEAFPAGPLRISLLLAS